MFSKELEDLIKATLEDGVLEDYEKAALVKRAQAEGVDLAELEIYINSILQRRKREQDQKKNAEQAAIEQKKKEEFGRTCPNCGRQVPPMTLKCECGYEFTSQKQVSSVQLLFDKIQEIRQQSEGKNVDDQIIETISMFPVPNTKEDIIEFCAMAIPKSKLKGRTLKTKIRLAIYCGIGTIICLVVALIIMLCISTDAETLGSTLGLIALAGVFACIYFFEDDLGNERWDKMANAWRAKFEQVIIKGRSMRGDPEFTQQLDYYEKLFRQK